MTASVSRDQRHVRAHPCAVCGGYDEAERGTGKRCSGFTRGEWIRCSRHEQAGGLASDEQGLFVHRIGECNCGTRHEPRAGTPDEMPRERKPRAQPEATYEYRDANGSLLCQVTRWPGKRFSQRRPDGAGGWIQNTKDVPWTLYRLPELVASTGTVYVVEGEKDVDNLRKAGFVATTNRGGSKTTNKSDQTDWKPLIGRAVVVIADKDDAETDPPFKGQIHAARIAKKLRDFGCSVTGPLECTRGKDWSDHAKAGGTIAELAAMVPPPDDKPAKAERPPIRLEDESPVGNVRALRPTNDGDIPHIAIGLDLERMTDAAIAALAKDERVYQRGGMLVSVVMVPEGPAKEIRGVSRVPGSRTIVPLEPGALLERISTCATWTKYDGRSRSEEPCNPPKVIVSTVLGRREWEGVRPLVGVATSPQLRPDGSVLQEAGYDSATGVLYMPNDSFADVSERPGVEDARGALLALRHVVCDFPFARPEHESAWVAGVLTMLARPAIDGPVPMFAVDATTRGTGKSRLVDAASMITHGHPCARTVLSEKDEEMRKRITSIAIDGDPSILIDNVTRPLAFPSLDAVLTSTVWKDRLLGKNSSVTAAHRTVWWTTGNNLDLGGDLARRSLHIRLESSLENPEERTGFVHPELLQWIGTQRHRLVASGLTILRAFVLSGSKYSGGLWGSFEEWSRLICGAIVFAGGVDPSAARATSDAAMDDEKRSLMVMIEGLHRLAPPGQALSAKSMLSALYPDRDPRDGPATPDGFDDLRDTIEQITRSMPGRQPEARRLGKWLQRVRGRVVGGWSIQRHDGPNHSAVWRSEQVAT